LCWLGSEAAAFAAHHSRYAIALFPFFFDDVPKYQTWTRSQRGISPSPSGTPHPTRSQLLHPTVKPP
jgi:hypothetical protein